MGQKSEIDKDAVRKILKVLRANYDEFTKGGGGPNDIEMHGDVSANELGQWPASQALSASTMAAFGQVQGKYALFLQSYDGIIQALERMVGNHEDADQQNAANANQVSANMNNSAPTTQNTQAY